MGLLSPLLSKVVRLTTSRRESEAEKEVKRCTL